MKREANRIGSLVIWVERVEKYKYFSHNEKEGHEYCYSCPTTYLFGE